MKVNPETGVGSVIRRKGRDIVWLLMEEGSEWGYYGYVDGDDIKLTRFSLASPADVYNEQNLGNILYFVILYVGKTIVVNCRVDATSTTPWYTVSFNTDLSLNLTYEKYMYHNHILNATDENTITHFMLASNHSSKEYIGGHFLQKFKPLTNDEVDIHIPVWLGGGGLSKTTTTVLNVNPVTAYPEAQTLQ